LERPHRSHRPAVRQRRGQPRHARPRRRSSRLGPHDRRISSGRGARPQVPIHCRPSRRTSLRPIVERGGAAVAANRQPSYVTVTRALLTGGAILALARVYSGVSWIVPLLLAASLPAAILAVGERRRWNLLASVGFAAVVGAWLSILVDDPGETLAGIPTASAL